jgi:hypothetical protein
MESFFLYLVKQFADKIGPVGGLIAALLLVLYYFERKAREKLTDRAFDLFTDMTKAMIEFNHTLEGIEHNLDDVERDLAGIKRKEG